jgi:hypothetical protein
MRTRLSPIKVMAGVVRVVIHVRGEMTSGSAALLARSWERPTSAPGGGAMVATPTDRTGRFGARARFVRDRRWCCLPAGAPGRWPWRLAVQGKPTILVLRASGTKAGPCDHPGIVRTCRHQKQENPQRPEGRGGSTRCPRGDALHTHTAHLVRLISRHGRRARLLSVPHDIVPRQHEQLSGGHPTAIRSTPRAARSSTRRR